MTEVVAVTPVEQFPDIALAVRRALWRARTAEGIDQVMRMVADQVESGRVLAGGSFSVPKMLTRLDLHAWMFGRVATRERELVGLLEELASELAVALDVGEAALVGDALARFASFEPTHLGRVRQLRRRVSLALRKAAATRPELTAGDALSTSPCTLEEPDGERMPAGKPFLASLSGDSLSGGVLERGAEGWSA